MPLYICYIVMEGHPLPLWAPRWPAPGEWESGYSRPTSVWTSRRWVPASLPCRGQTPGREHTCHSSSCSPRPLHLPPTIQNIYSSGPWHDMTWHDMTSINISYLLRYLDIGGMFGVGHSTGLSGNLKRNSWHCNGDKSVYNTAMDQFLMCD